MTRYTSGDSRAFEQLCARHKGPLFRYFKRQCDANVVEELYQDVWMRLVKARENCQVEAKLTTCLYRIAHNRLCGPLPVAGSPERNRHDRQQR